MNAKVGIINCLPPRANESVRSLLRASWPIWVVLVAAAVLLSFLT